MLNKKMSYFPSRHLKTQKKLDRLKKQQTESLRSQTAQRQIFNETLISEFLPSGKSILQKEQDNFQDNHIFASRSHIRSLTSNKSNPSIQKRRQKFFMAVCSVRDIKQPLKTDIIKISYNTPLKKRKSQKQHFPLNCQNIKFGLPQRVKFDGNDQNGPKNSIVEMLHRKLSNKQQRNQIRSRPFSAVETRKVAKTFEDKGKTTSREIKSIQKKIRVGPRRYLSTNSKQISSQSITKNNVKVNRSRQTFTLSPWQSHAF